MLEAVAVSWSAAERYAASAEVIWSSTQSLRALPPCSFPAAELLTRRPGRASQLGSSNVVRNLHFMAPLSAALANGDDTLRMHHGRLLLRRSGPRGCAAGLLHLLSGHSVGRLPYRGSAGRGDDQRHHGRAAGLLHLLTSRTASAHADAGRHHGRAAGLPDGPGPGCVHNQERGLAGGERGVRGV